MFQFPSKTNAGVLRPPLVMTSPEEHDKELNLPDNCTSVQPVALNVTSVAVPECQLKQECANDLAHALTEEKEWIEHGIEMLKREAIEQDDVIAWSEFHASRQTPSDQPPAITELLPLFNEKAATPAMIKHTMDIQKQAINFLNPGQTDTANDQTGTNRYYQ